MKAPAADITIRENYLDFINKATTEFKNYKKDYERIINAKNTTYDELSARKEDIAIKLHIDLDVYTEYTLKEFNDSFSLYNRVVKLHKENINSDSKDLIILLLKWCSIINKERYIIEHLHIAAIKADMKYKNYREYVFNYYCHVHKHILEGKGYKFKNGVGTIYFDRIQLSPYSRKIDFAATKKRKEELLAQGKRIFNKTEADICDTLGYEYDGEDYRVFMNASHCLKLCIINSFYFRGRNFDFRPISYIHLKYRGQSHKSIIENHCKSIDDIPFLRVDLRTKVALLLMMDNTKYINFDRKLT